METEALRSIQQCLVAVKKIASHTHVNLGFGSLKKVCKDLAFPVLFYDQTESQKRNRFLGFGILKWPFLL